MEKKTVKTLIDGVEFSLETGWVARQADGAVWCRYGDTIVLATAVGRREPKEGQDFFPLTVDYNEKMYAAGKIPGSFFKREARPSNEATLIARMIDRPLRPLFPEGYISDVHVTVNVLSYDGIHHPEVLATVAASAALGISPIPFLGPVASVVVGLIAGVFVVNPSTEQLETSDLHLSIAGTKDAIMMVEAGANIISEDQMLKALKLGHEAIQKLVALQDDFNKVAGKAKWDVPLLQINKELLAQIEPTFVPLMKKALATPGKLEKYAAIDAVKAGVLETGKSILGDAYESKLSDLNIIFEHIESKVVREAIVNDKLRADGRSLTEIRPLRVEVGVLPRAHGSAVFTRGETQSLGTVTLGVGKDEVMVDGLDDTFRKRFYLHYNFPSFSVNEVGGRPGPGRREIGHGALAERAVSYVIPSQDDFPYVVRVVSDILESNGSSSMATVCSATLSLMDAGVPIIAPVAGIAMGLVMVDGKYQILTDIAGLEDHLGDMDFKVAGTTDGITALQMDIKITGISFEIIEKALAQAKAARLEILQKMSTVQNASNADLSEYAPRLEIITIPEDKVGELIGPGGKNIRAIIERTGATIDIQDGGRVYIASADKKSLEAARFEISGYAKVLMPGEQYTGTVKRIMNFGMFLEVLPGKEGLLHISKAGTGEYIKNLEDHFKEGDQIEVVIDEIDSKGRVNFVRAK